MIIVTTTTKTPSPVPTIPTRRPYRGLTVYLTGADGSTWDITNGPVRLQPGVTGLLPGDVEPRWGGSPTMPGSTWRGHRVTPEEFTLPVLVRGAVGLPFRDLDAQLWGALVQGEECVLSVVTPDAVVRTMPVRFLGVGGGALERDPLIMGHVPYPLSFVAPDPRWRGAVTSQTFRPTGDPPPFFATSGGVLNIASGQSTANSTVRNAGDVAAWPVYAVTGPVASFQVGVGANTIDFEAVAAGSTVWIDTHPAAQTVGYSRGDNSEDAWSRLTARRFEAVPPGAEVPIVVVLDEPGDEAAIRVELTPRYIRPW